MNERSQLVWVGLSFLVVGLTLGLVLSKEDFFEGIESDEAVQIQSQTQAANLPTLDELIPQRVSVSSDDDAVMGEVDAPVTLVEFSDYQCPYCYSFHMEIFPYIKENYIDKGLVKFVYRDYPLPKHVYSDEAALAAECVGEQGDEEYFAMHDLIFTNIADFNQSLDPNAFLVDLADQLGADIEDCLMDRSFMDEIEGDFIAASTYGVSATPYFFVNGIPVRGARGQLIVEAIESELANLE